MRANRNFKWAYNLPAKKLLVWAVDGPQSYAVPQHGDKLSTEEYATFYQGRLTIDGNVTHVLTYPERPFVDRTEEGATEATKAITDWREKEVYA